MRALSLILKLAGPMLILIGVSYLTLGVGPDVLPDVLLDAKAFAAVSVNSVLDSQTRVYGVAFCLYGVLLLLSSTNIPKYAKLLHGVVGVFFVAGLARLASMAFHGVPSPLIVMLVVSELVIPFALVWWLSRVTQDNSPIHPIRSLR